MKQIKTTADLFGCRKTDAILIAPHAVRDAVLLGDWNEVKDIPAETLRKWTSKPEDLTGLILRGYEMKWDKTNENGERYEKTAFDDFIKRYFVEGGLNMPVDINHEGGKNWRAYCGRVLYIEVNSVGFYFVVNIPSNYECYEQLKWGLQNGIIQGFSKEGWATDWEPKWKEDGTFDYELIKKISVMSVSLVTTPANGLEFERMQEIRNALIFKNKTQQGKSFAELFNNNH